MKPQVILVSVRSYNTTPKDVSDSLLELSSLVNTLDFEVRDVVVQYKNKIDPAFYIGKGKAEEIGGLVKELDIALVVFDFDLSPAQKKNLEKLIDCELWDRTQVILQIFRLKARTREAKTQVEIANLKYLLPSLIGGYRHLSRQRGGIGLKGVGEKAIEADRRVIKSRIKKLEEELEDIKRTRDIKKKQRKNYLLAALVGYTNSGKSTLMNKLTKSDVYVDDRLFATLDTNVRVMDPKATPPIMLSDTVGFIKKLPTDLVASFNSTLEEIKDADLLLHVVDLSDSNFKDRIDVTDEVLYDLGITAPQIFVFNKIDLLKDSFMPRIVEARYKYSLAISALKDEDISSLHDRIVDFFERDMVEVNLQIPYTEGKLISDIHDYSKIVKKEYENGVVFIKVKISKKNLLKMHLDQYQEKHNNK